MNQNHIMSQRRIMLLTTFGVALAVGLTFVLWIGGRAPATANAPVPAMQAMSAMKRPQTRAVNVPALVTGLPNDMVARPGTVHELLSSVGRTGNSFYAWRRGSTEGVCYVSTRAGGGCFDDFLGPFNASVTDFDRLGSGAPVVVSGPVRDDVIRVDVVVSGNTYQALIKNNVAFFELQDPEALPDAVERIIVTLADGTSEDVRL